jgi:chromosome segregation ATPase
MPDEQSYRKKMESQLNDLGAQIHDLLNKVGTEVDKEVEALRPKLRAAQDKLDELKHTSVEAWGDLKPGLEKAWAELQKSFSQAAARFRTPRNKE